MSSTLNLSNPSLLRDKAYINGKWVSGKSGKKFDVTDPGTGKVISQVDEFGVEETKEAISAASNAFKSFKYTTARERSNLLRKWFYLMKENAEDLAKLITYENGKPLADARGEAAYAATFFEWFSEEAPRAYGDVIPSTSGLTQIHTVKQPVGVCGIITPWNFPSAMITRKIGPALAAGCTVVVKPGGETPLSALALAVLAEQAGIPAGVFNVIPTLANTKEIGQELCENPEVRKVSFTGSTAVGKILMRQSASTLNKLSFELGGNAPFIVFDDADLDRAVRGAIACKFRSSGQTCVCANRLYVQEGIYDAFVEKFAAEVEKLKLGNGFGNGVTHGPLIHDKAIEKVQQHVEDAISKGGKVLVGGHPAKSLGENFYELTVVRDAPYNARVATEETFGPLAAIFKFKTEKDVIQAANSVDVGLAGYFYSRDYERIIRVSTALEVGMVGVNTGIISDPAAPFGGVKESGFGREGSKYGMDEYQIIKTITIGGNLKPAL